MKSRIILVVIVLFLLAYYVVNIMFKVNYVNNDVAMMDSLKINDSVIIPKGYIVLGRNYKGVIEATILPTQESRFQNKGIVEYCYLRFDPDWFEKHIAPRINNYLQSRDQLVFELVKKARIAHKDNFEYCCHFNDYPIVRKGILFARISLLGVAEKITFSADVNKT